MKLFIDFWCIEMNSVGRDSIIRLEMFHIIFWKIFSFSFDFFLQFKRFQSNEKMKKT